MLYFRCGEFKNFCRCMFFDVVFAMALVVGACTRIDVNDTRAQFNDIIMYAGHVSRLIDVRVQHYARGFSGLIKPICIEYGEYVMHVNCVTFHKVLAYTVFVPVVQIV